MSEAMYYRETRKRAAVPEYDRTLVWLAVLLLGLGLVMVYSSSIAIAEGGRNTGEEMQEFKSGLYYLGKKRSSCVFMQI